MTVGHRFGVCQFRAGISPAVSTRRGIAVAEMTRGSGGAILLQTQTLAGARFNVQFVGAPGGGLFAN
jgi:hypothetical protein